MATPKLVSKKGGIWRYQYRAYVGKDADGKKIQPLYTFELPLRPPPGEGDYWTPAKGLKAATQIAQEWENLQRNRRMKLDYSTTFAEFSERWMKSKKRASKTLEQYDYLLREIKKWFGEKRIGDVVASDIEDFYRYLREDCFVQNDNYAYSATLNEVRSKAKMSQSKLASLSGVSPATVGAACNTSKEPKERHISIQSAELISKALSTPLEELFSIHKSERHLSDTTIGHYHVVIRAILEYARKKGAILINEATDRMEAPPLKRREAKYYDEKQAQKLLMALNEETDIRIKTALTIALYTGVRLGELCGLEWEDIDFEDAVIRVRRSSQRLKNDDYPEGYEDNPKSQIVEGPTKTVLSVRDIDVDKYVIKVLSEYQNWWSDYRDAMGDGWQGAKNRLFIQKNGKPIDPKTINNWLEKTAKSVELPVLTAHGLRHTYATLQLAFGLDYRDLKELTGHAQTSTLVDTYTHVIKSKKKKAAHTIHNVLQGSK